MGKAKPLGNFHLLFYFRLRFPAIGAHPGAQYPFREKPRIARHRTKFVHDLFGGAFEQINLRPLAVAPFGKADSDLSVGAKIEIHLDARIYVDPEAVGRKEKGHGEIGVLSLIEAFFAHQSADEFALLIDAVELFPETVCGAVCPPQRPSESVGRSFYVFFFNFLHNARQSFVFIIKSISNVRFQGELTSTSSTSAAASGKFSPI